MFILVMKPIALLLLLVGVISIFLSRDIVKIKADIEKENRLVETIRVAGYVITIVSLIALYFLTR